MQFDGDILSALAREDAQRLAREIERRVCGVNHKQRVVRLRKCNRLVIELDGRRRTCRIVRIVQINQLAALLLVVCQRIQIWQEIVLLQQRQIHDFSAEILCPCTQNRIAWHCHYGYIAWIDESRGQKRQR